ncbi:NRT1/ PTR family 1.2-like protein [Tanacetum coccineum]
MSAMWLVPQQVFGGLSEALNIIGQMEFYYSKFPKSMSSVATSLYLLGADRTVVKGQNANIVGEEDVPRSEHCGLVSYSRGTLALYLCPTSINATDSGPRPSFNGPASSKYYSSFRSALLSFVLSI